MSFVLPIYQLNLLNLLLTRNYDAEIGYKNATENIQNAALEKFFIEQSNNRRTFAAQLAKEIEKLEGTPSKGTSLKADLHRAWMDWKAFLGSNEEEIALLEILRGESKAHDNYDEILKEHVLDADSSIYNLLQSHRTSIHKAIVQLQKFESLLATA